MNLKGRIKKIFKKSKKFVRRKLAWKHFSKKWRTTQPCFFDGLHYKSIISNNRMRRHWNIHKGERCFIIGTGPSINNTDLSLLKNEITFCMNRGYIINKEFKLIPTYYVAIDPILINSYATDIDKLNYTKFLNWQQKEIIDFDRHTIFIKPTNKISFPVWLTDYYWHGGSVTYVALQLAYYFGIKQVILIGVDHNYHLEKTNKGKLITTVSDGNDPNHFSPNYFQKGVEWAIPDMELKELGYFMAKRAFEEKGREIIDATIGGKLKVFPKLDYYSLFTEVNS